MSTKMLISALILSAMLSPNLMYAQPVQYYANEYWDWGGRSVTVEDVTGDGYLDLVSVNLEEFTTATYTACGINIGSANPGTFGEYGGGGYWWLVNPVPLPFSWQAKYGKLRSWEPILDLGLGSCPFQGSNNLYTYINNHIPSVPLSLNQTITSGNNDFVAWGDLEGDGDDDMVTCDYFSSGSVHVYRNDYSTLNQQSDFNVGSDADQVQLVDLDKGDDYTLPELCVVSIGGELKIYNNSGTSPFFSLRQTLDISESPTTYIKDYTVADLNNDDYNDIVLAHAAIHVFLNQGDGTFPAQANQVIPMEYGYSNCVACGEWDSLGLYDSYDGFPDLVYQDGSSLYIRLNLANPGQNVFSDNVVWQGYAAPMTGQARDVTFADFNSKGSQSVVATGISGGYSFSYNWTNVWRDNSDPRPCPVEHLALTCVNDHPFLTWDFKQEQDMHYGDAAYRVYRMLTQNHYPTQDDEFIFLANTPYTSNTYTDEEVALHQQSYNVHAFYMVRARDDGVHESLNSDTVDCIGLWHQNSLDDPKSVSGVVIPTAFGCNASPNPFNPSTTITFSLPEAATVNLAVYDVNGRQVAQLVNGLQQAGIHQVAFHGADLPAGIYFYRLSAGQHSATGKMLLLK